MAYEHKTTKAVDPQPVRAFTVKDTGELAPEWDFGADFGRIRSYDFNRGDKRFIQRISDETQLGAVAMVKYVNSKVREDGRERVVLKLEEPFQVTWTVLEP